MLGERSAPPVEKTLTDAMWLFALPCLRPKWQISPPQKNSTKSQKNKFL
jgi:hypothetical protein